MRKWYLFPSTPASWWIGKETLGPTWRELVIHALGQSIWLVWSSFVIWDNPTSHWKWRFLFEELIWISFTRLAGRAKLGEIGLLAGWSINRGGPSGRLVEPVDARTWRWLGEPEAGRTRGWMTRWLDKRPVGRRNETGRDHWLNNHRGLACELALWSLPPHNEKEGPYVPT